MVRFFLYLWCFLLFLFSSSFQAKFLITNLIASDEPIFPKATHIQTVLQYCAMEKEDLENKEKLIQIVKEIMSSRDVTSISFDDLMVLERIKRLK